MMGFLLSSLSLALLLLAHSRCQAQQAPFYTTEKFDENADHRTDVCDRYRQLYLDQISLPDALSGLDLSVVLTDYIEPLNQELFSLQDGVVNPDRTPLFAIVMDELAKRGGFSWRNTFGVVRPVNPETDGNKTWTDLLRWEVEKYDIAMGRWDRTASRIADEISFPEGWMDSSVILVQSDSSETDDSNLFSFLRPFTGQVWVLIVITLIVSGLLYYSLERIDSQTDDQPLESEPGSAIFYSFVTFTGHNEFSPRTNGARLFVFSLTLWALIIAAAYTANLASFLVARNQPESAIRSLDEAVLVGAPICVQGGVAQDQFVTEKHPGAVLVRKINGPEVLLGLQRGECDVALAAQSEFELLRRNKEVNGDCDLSSIGRVEKYVPSGLATAVDTGTYCSSLVSHVLDYHLIQMAADGFFEREIETFLNRVGDQNCVSEAVVAAQENNEDTYSLTVQEMSGIFIVHAGFSCFALLLAVLKYFWVKRQARRHRPSTTEEPASKKSDIEGGKGPSLKTMNGEDEETHPALIENGEEEETSSALIEQAVSSSFEAGAKVAL